MIQTKSIYDCSQETISFEPSNDQSIIKTVRLTPIDMVPRPVDLSLIGIPRNLDWRYEFGTRAEIIAREKRIKAICVEISKGKRRLDSAIAFFDGRTYWLASGFDNVTLSQRTNAQCWLITYHGTEQDAAEYAVTKGHAWDMDAL